MNWIDGLKRIETTMCEAKAKQDKEQEYTAALVQLAKQGVNGINGMSIRDAIKLSRGA